MIHFVEGFCAVSCVLFYVPKTFGYLIRLIKAHTAHLHPNWIKSAERLTRGKQPKVRKRNQLDALHFPSCLCLALEMLDMSSSMWISLTITIYMKQVLNTSESAVSSDKRSLCARDDCVILFPLCEHTHCLMSFRYTNQGDTKSLSRCHHVSSCAVNACDIPECLIRERENTSAKINVTIKRINYATPGWEEFPLTTPENLAYCIREDIHITWEQLSDIVCFNMCCSPVCSREEGKRD